MNAGLGEHPPGPETPDTGASEPYDGHADEHARARAAAQATAAARARASEGAVTQPPRAPEGLPAPAYAGLVTRAIAFGIDATAINAAAITVGVIAGLALSLFNVPSGAVAIVAVIGSIIYVLWTVGYFVTFWSTTGVTPGARVMRLRVLDAHDANVRLRPRRALLRLVGMFLSALLLFTGFLLVLVDNRRRGLHDRLARTIVVYTS